MRRSWTGGAALALAAVAMLAAVAWTARGGTTDGGRTDGGDAARAAAGTSSAAAMPVGATSSAATSPAPLRPLHTGNASPPAALAVAPAPGTAIPAAAPPASAAAPAPEPVPTAPPAGVTWQVWHTIALPYSPAAGPASVQGDAVAGFARTPTGALLAAVHATSRKVAATDPGWRQVALTMIAPGPGRDAWLRARARVQRPDLPPPGTFAQVAGFQFVSWSPADAVLQLASRDADGDLGVITVHVTWLDGDWRLVLAPDGGDATSKQRLPSLAGFVAWGGV